MLSFFCEQKLFCTFQTNIILHYVNWYSLCSN
jgi:uncharacterized membrane protein (DUF106 family)